MKTSLKKLRGFGLHKHEKSEHRFRKSLAQIDELAEATQDMQDMKDCYDSLFSAAAATANCVYEFSESLREMGDCLLEKTALNDNEESAKVLLMLGKAQFDLQKHLDNYRSHISQTITVPSESLLNELRVVEEMKNQCDEKREIYEYVFSRYKDKGRLRGSKGESFSSYQLQTAHDEYEEEATLFVFRMKSLKQGQSRSLLTQAARHHAAQLCLFRKAFKSLEAIEPYLKLVTEQQHIDYQFCGFEDDNADGGHSDDDDDNEGLDDGSEAQDDGELSFDYGRQEVLTSISSMETDSVDLTFSQVVSTDTVKENFEIATGGNSIFSRENKASSNSAPLFAENKIDLVERISKMQPCSSRKLHTYVLPTPVEAHSPISGKSDVQVHQARRASLSGNKLNLWHSSPLVQRKNENIVGNEKLSGPIILNNTQSVLKESNNISKSIKLPTPLTEGVPSRHPDPNSASDAKKIKRYAFSGPLTGKSKPIVSSGGPIVSTGQSRPFSGSLLGTPLPRPFSTTELSSSVGPPFQSSPKISELHELPRPPPYLASKRENLIRHSGSLLSKTQDFSSKNKSVAFAAVSTLPVPSRSISRSYSIPSNDERKMVHDSTPLETTPDLQLVEGNASPTLMPFSLSNARPTSTA